MTMAEWIDVRAPQVLGKWVKVTDLWDSRADHIQNVLVVMPNNNGSTLKSMIWLKWWKENKVEVINHNPTDLETQRKIHELLSDPKNTFDTVVISNSSIRWIENTTPYTNSLINSIKTIPAFKEGKIFVLSSETGNVENADWIINIEDLNRTSNFYNLLVNKTTRPKQ